MQAFRIVNWWRYEVLKNGKKAGKKTKMGALRENPLVYVRFDVNADKNQGHVLSADYRRLLDEAGPELAAACDGLYKMLVGLAGNQVREYRGWVLDDRQRPLDSGQIAKFLCLSKEKVRQIFGVLTDTEVDFVEFLDFPESLHKSWNSKDFKGNPNSGKIGKNQEKKGAPLYETETEELKIKGFVSKRNETEEGDVREKKGAVEREGESQGGGKNVQPQPRPPAQASVPVSDSDTVPASDSEKITVSDSASEPVSDSVSQPGPGAGAGAEGPVPLTGMRRFNVYLERNEAEKKVMRILKVNLNKKSDTTTICDIYEQFADRLIIGDTTYPLFEHSLNTARQCWRAKNQIAMFVAAMKKPPFSYDPLRRSVIPGSFSNDRR